MAVTDHGQVSGNRHQKMYATKPIKAVGFKKRLLFLFLFSTVCSSSLGAEVQVERIHYRGWDNAIEVSNENTRLVVVPTIGRVMHYGLIQGPNLLWVNPEFQGSEGIPNPAVDQSPSEWANYGGDKVWPIPQDLFEKVNGRPWPPDHFIDGSKHAWKVLHDGVELRSPVSEYSGVQISRSIRLADSGTRVTINQRIDKIKRGRPAVEPIPLVAWSVSQIVDPSEVVLPLSGNSRFPKGVHIFPFQPKAEENLAIGQTTAFFQSSPVFDQKIGADSGPWLAASVEGFVFVQFFERHEGEPYADGGCSLEVYTCPSYTELEVLSPLHELEVGEGFDFTVEWELRRIGEAVPGTNSRVHLLRQIEAMLDK